MPKTQADHLGMARCSLAVGVGKREMTSAKTNKVWMS